MNKQVVIFVNLNGLYNILNEIKNFISFDIQNYTNKDVFFQDLNKNNILAESTIVTNSIEYFKSDNKNLDKRNILIFEDFPIQISTIIDQINIQLIKQRYDFQSKINIKNYNLNLNSRKISKNERDLKLTEREIDIILFLKKQKECAEYDKDNPILKSLKNNPVKVEKINLLRKLSFIFQHSCVKNNFCSKE